MKNSVSGTIQETFHVEVPEPFGSRRSTGIMKTGRNSYLTAIPVLLEMA